MTPGESFIEKGNVELNAGAPKRKVEVRNAGDRPIQVGSLPPQLAAKNPKKVKNGKTIQRWC